MIYKIKLDDYDIYGNQPGLYLESPSVKIDLNSAGSLEFTMTKEHKYYNYPKLLSSDLEVYENDELIWFGRVLEINTGMNLNKQVVGEGPLAFFNDSIQRPRVYDTTTVHDFFNAVIESHNNQVPENRRFTVGQVTVTDTEIYRELNYETTKKVLEDMCLGAEGGYFFFRKENGVNYIDWIKDLEDESIQPVKFGLNLVDISKHINGGDIKTSILPLGQEIDGERVTIISVNDGKDYLDSEAVDTYGRILEVVEFDDIARPDELYDAASKWLSDQQFDPLTIKCNAAELNYLNNAYPAFKVGQLVRVTSEPHIIDKVLPLTTIDISMDSAVKQISIGTPEKREISEIYKNGNSYSSGGYSSSGGSSGGGGSSSYTNGDGITIANRRISVKIGNGLELNQQNGNIDVVRRNVPELKSLTYTGSGAATRDITFYEKPSLIVSITKDDPALNELCTIPVPYGTTKLYSASSNQTTHELLGSDLAYSDDDLTMTISGTDEKMAFNEDTVVYTVYYFN